MDLLGQRQAVATRHLGRCGPGIMGFDTDFQGRGIGKALNLLCCYLDVLGLGHLPAREPMGSRQNIEA